MSLSILCCLTRIEEYTTLSTHRLLYRFIRHQGTSTFMKNSTCRKRRIDFWCFASAGTYLCQFFVRTAVCERYLTCDLSVSLLRLSSTVVIIIIVVGVLCELCKVYTVCDFHQRVIVLSQSTRTKCH